jgi:hypothetical protein
MLSFLFKKFLEKNKKMKVTSKKELSGFAPPRGVKRCNRIKSTYISFDNIIKMYTIIYAPKGRHGTLGRLIQKDLQDNRTRRFQNKVKQFIKRKKTENRNSQKTES